MGFGTRLFAPPPGRRFECEGDRESAPYVVDLPLMVLGVPLPASAASLCMAVQEGGPPGCMAEGS
ncbi:hypothetical protein [Streptomyces sp. MP131-18]|uniref:hypothetical protein n=1 Tax=Streptomyces sp. MP131-18 TaxID=1857892 RepID=UPI00097C4CC0|nr:hypothetical protein [Streptomyces sp. MP131-18]ONK13439.1 hypothetical protein STBA_42060 [Streptomyces sp. MP131-18]